MNRSLVLLAAVIFVTVTVLGAVSIAFLASEVHELRDSIGITSSHSDSHSHAGPVYHAVHNVSDVLQSHSAQLKDLEAKVQSQEAEINQLRAQMAHAVNSTITFLNDTVSEAQQTMQQEVQTVDAEVDQQGSLIAYQAAGFFTVLTILVFIWHISSHLREMHEPTIQRKILAILWMCPIYGITSWLSLILVERTREAEWYLAVIKDCYEAYLIYVFLSFLIAVLGKGDRAAVVDLLVDRADHLRPPVDFCGLFFNESRYDCNPRGRADAILYQCQFCAMQFVFLRPVTSLGVALSNQFYGTDWDYRSPQFVFVMIQNVSIFVAFSGLLKFYHATREDLSWCNPFPKFLCIKGVVFMTFWQGMVITILAKAVFMVDDPMEWSRQAQNFLTCLEMLFFAIAHCFAFPTEEWQPGFRPREKKQNLKFGDNIALRDFARDVKFILKSRKKHRINRKEGDSPYEGLSPANAATVAFGENDEEEFGNEAEEASETGEGAGNSFIIVYSPSREEDDGNVRRSSAVLLRGDGEARDLPVDLRNLEDSIREATRKRDAASLQQSTLHVQDAAESVSVATTSLETKGEIV